MITVISNTFKLKHMHTLFVVDTAKNDFESTIRNELRYPNDVNVLINELKISVSSRNW